MTDLSNISCTIAADVLDHLIQMAERTPQRSVGDRAIMLMAWNNVNNAVITAREIEAGQPAPTQAGIITLCPEGQEKSCYCSQCLAVIFPDETN